MPSPGEAAFDLSYVYSPIIFCNGIAANYPGGVLPIISITESSNFPSGVSGAGTGPGPAGYFARFAPLPGATAFEADYGTYSFANQAVAGNAAIISPRVLSMLMICPAKGGYADAQARFTALISAFSQHVILGGTFTVITPKLFWTNMLLKRVPDVSTAESKQAQNTWQLDFFKPLLTLEEAQAAQSSLMSKLSSGTQIQGQPSYSGASSTVGQPSSLAGASIPAGAGTAGTNTAPLPTPPKPH